MTHGHGHVARRGGKKLPRGEFPPRHLLMQILTDTHRNVLIFQRLAFHALIYPYQMETKAGFDRVQAQPHGEQPDLPFKFRHGLPLRQLPQTATLPRRRAGGVLLCQRCKLFRAGLQLFQQLSGNCALLVALLHIIRCGG